MPVWVGLSSRHLLLVCIYMLLITTPVNYSSNDQDHKPVSIAQLKDSNRGESICTSDLATCACRNATLLLGST